MRAATLSIDVRAGEVDGNLEAALVLYEQAEVIADAAPIGTGIAIMMILRNGI